MGAGALIWVSPKSARAGGRGWGEGEKDLIHCRFNSFRHRRALGATVASGGPAGGGTWGGLTWAPACAGPASRGRSQRPVRPGAAPVTNEVSKTQEALRRVPAPFSLGWGGERTGVT